MRLIAAILAGYVLGGLPTGVLIARWVGGINLLETGSGHTGGTNVARATGNVWAGVLTMLLDMLLGAAGVWVARAFSPSPWAPALAGVATLAGHNWSPYVGFRGGVGLACMAGMLLAQTPLPSAAAGAAFIALWVALRKLLGHDARATVCALPIVPLLLWLMRQPVEVCVSGLLAVVASWVPTLSDWRRRYARNEGLLGQIGVEE